jgi:hypothetical protein
MYHTVNPIAAQQDPIASESGRHEPSIACRFYKMSAMTVMIE